MPKKPTRKKVASRRPARKAMPQPSGEPLSRRTTAVKGISASGHIRATDGMGVLGGTLGSWVPRKVKGTFYESMREAIPVLDAAVDRLTNLDGRVVLAGSDRLVRELEDWFDNVPVGDTQNGIQALHQEFTAEAHEQGFSVFDSRTDRKRRTIEGFRVADSKTIKLKRIADRIEHYQAVPGATDVKLDDRALAHYANRTEAGNPYGISAFRSLEVSSQVFATIMNATRLVFARWGDPSLHAHMKAFNAETQEELTARH